MNSPAEYDVAVVGAGPAGLAATAAAADAGLSVAVVDAGARVGGQYYRHPASGFGAARPQALHHDWATFARLRDAFAAHIERGGVNHLVRHHAWGVERGDDTVTVHLLVGEPPTAGRSVRARVLVVATGAYDRQLPFPGWELPGVMAAGCAQALLKGDLTLAGRRVVVAGTGPFLLPVAAGLATAGTRVAGVFEANSLRGYARQAGGVAGGVGKLGEAVGYLAVLARHHVPIRTRHVVVAAHGTGSVTAAEVARVDAAGRIVPGSRRRVPCDTVAVGYGFTPQMEIPLALGCATRVDADGSLVVAVDEGQRTDLPGVLAAGETTGVGGAALALVEGELAGFTAAGDLGRPLPTTPGHVARRRRRRAALRRFARVLNVVHRIPAGWTTWLTDDTIVCRCEEVRLGQVRAAVHDHGATDARSVKLLARPGMGWCQGRLCGHATAWLTAELTGRVITTADLAGLGQRPLARPVPLEHLAQEVP